MLQGIDDFTIVLPELTEMAAGELKVYYGLDRLLRMVERYKKSMLTSMAFLPELERPIGLVSNKLRLKTPNSASTVASFPVGPHPERIHWRNHASFGSTPITSSPCPCR